MCPDFIISNINIITKILRKNNVFSRVFGSRSRVWKSTTVVADLRSRSRIDRKITKFIARLSDRPRRSEQRATGRSCRAQTEGFISGVQEETSPVNAEASWHLERTPSFSISLLSCRVNKLISSSRTRLRKDVAENGTKLGATRAVSDVVAADAGDDVLENRAGSRGTDVPARQAVRSGLPG